MTRLYIRLVVLMGIAFLVSIVVMLGFLAKLNQIFYRPQFAQEMTSLAAELEGELAGLDAAGARGVLAGLGGERVFRVQVVEEGEPDRDGVYYLRPSGAGFRLALEPDPDLVKRFSDRQGAQFLASLLVVGIIIAVAALLVILPLVGRLRAQEQTILRIAEGDLGARAPTGSRDALGMLGERINQMADKINGLIDGQRQLIHAVSHEMRTPTARLGFGLDMLAEAKTPEERERRITAMHDDVAEMDAILGELILFLRFGEPAGELPVDEIALRELVGSLTAKIEGATAIEIALAPEATVVASAKYLPRVVGNLLRNAARHARSRVRISQDAGGSLVVEDDGPGVPEEDRERVFEPFVKLGGGGTGLGLAIARRIVERHGGTMRVAGSADLGGARFVVELQPGK